MNRLTALLCGALLLPAAPRAQVPAPSVPVGLRPKVRPVAAAPARREQLRVYLLLGQSNMAGRGVVEAADTTAPARVWRLNPAGQWEQAKDPLHFDKPVAGVGPGLSFGRAMAAAEPEAVIGLVPCAVGGTAISTWQPGALDAATNTHPYDDALRRARVALQSGTLAGILWNQGEADSSPEKSQAYAQHLAALIGRLRQDLGAPAVPFVAAQLPAFQYERPDSLGPRRASAGAVQLNATVAGLAQTVPHYAYITTEGTRHRGDQLHYDAASARLLGRRYAAAMLRLQAEATSPPAPKPKSRAPAKPTKSRT
ncbi:sialate O-acetylesterase [Hymenobacter sp. 15J16-1T3B]|uniref:sialate O-acetylesterase n=1 Tax=Hymenobacter sp. 15J16-1T3B TaxID=2886941 RepID=UPI001D128588|nr:sialate O-acetylesterase [Hymenobacter sp. 15J16-1T3B]MCC3156668.1 sialate O-acetylesterase [Hymenobacter sp. 15J16-1T3B]